MWLRLDDHDTAFLIELLDRERKERHHIDDEGAKKLQVIFDRLNAEADPIDDQFRNAVATSDELEVDPDAVVSRGDDGAFVMSWSWVSNEDAGVVAACENCGSTDNDGSDICVDCGGNISSK